MRLSVILPNLLALSFTAVGSLVAIPAAADDTVITIGTGDRFVVKDGNGVEQLILDGTTGLLSAPAGVDGTFRLDGADGPNAYAVLLVSGGVLDGQETHPLAIYRKDTAQVAWLWKSGGSAITNTSLKIDGAVLMTKDPVTDQILVHNDPGYMDPDKAAAIPAMLQVGADVEFAMTIRPNNAGCSGCSPARPKPKAILLVDYGHDWVWELAYDGQMRWGDVGPTPFSDGDKGEASFDTGLYRVENGADEFMEFELDSDNDGNGTRRVAVSFPHPQGTGSASLGGVMVWGNTGVAAIDSGDEVCASVTGGTGLTCQTTLDPTDGSEHACGSPHPGSDATASGIFQALCY